MFFDLSIYGVLFWLNLVHKVIDVEFRGLNCILRIWCHTISRLYINIFNFNIWISIPSRNHSRWWLTFLLGIQWFKRSFILIFFIFFVFDGQTNKFGWNQLISSFIKFLDSKSSFFFYDLIVCFWRILLVKSCLFKSHGQLLFHKDFKIKLLRRLWFIIWRRHIYIYFDQKLKNIIFTET